MVRIAPHDAAELTDAGPMRTVFPSPGSLRRTRVLLIGLNYTPEPTGIAPYTAGLARGLVERGFDVTVITTFPHYPQWRIQAPYRGLLQREVVDGVTVIRVRPLLWRKPGLVPRALMEIAFGLAGSLLPWRAPDEVVLVSPALFATAVLSLRCRLQKVPSTVWVQDIYSLGVSQTADVGRVQRVVAALETAVLSRADKLVVIHDRFAGAVRGALKVRRDEIDVVRNWTHVALPEGGDRVATRARLGWGEDETIVLHAGAIGAKQGLENVVAAAALAAGQGSRLRFVLLGDGSRRAHLQSMPESRHVDFMDPLGDDDFTAALRAADVLLVSERPGLTEMSVPSKLTTYFATERPVVVVADATSVTAEELVHSGGGVRVDTDRPADLVAAVEALSDDVERQVELARAAKAYAETKLSRRFAIDSFAALLQR